MTMKKCVKKARIWNLIVLFSSLIPLCSTANTYQLKTHAEYLAFSGDLSVNFTIPSHVSIPDAFIRLVLLTDSVPEEITTMHSIDSERKTGTRNVRCGIIELAGNYEFQMHMYLGGPILARTSVIVRWPNITLSLPSTHKAQSASVPLKFISTAVCNPLLRRYSFQVNLEYASSSLGISVVGREEVLLSVPFSNFSAYEYSVEFPCRLFDISGIYRASLVSSFSAISIVSQSNSMITELNPAFKINIWSQTIFPCSGVLQVDYVQPLCPGTKENNRIRMYMLRRKSSGSLAAPLVKTYVLERFVDPDRTSMFVNCSVFETAAAGYCFQYISFARNKAIINQTDLCLSAHPDSVLPVDGGWSAWSQWSACSVTCGAGKQHRHRMCNSPTPNYGGAFCAGGGMLERPCNSTCPESIPRTPLHSATPDEDCPCGCKVYADVGEIIASGRCQRTSTWKIIAPERYQIKLSFQYLNFYQNKQWVKVRNGGRQDSDLIAFTDGRKDLTHVTSTANEMLIEFWSEPWEEYDVTFGNRTTPAPYDIVVNRAIHVHGFIATFRTNRTLGGAYPILARPIRADGKPSIWESTVTIVGISLCALVVLTAVVFVVYNRACAERHHKYAMAAHEESPKRMCKSTSMHSSTPSRESHHGIEIEHDMEIPLTGNSVGDKRRVKTPGSTKSRGSLSSACSHNVKKLKTKVEIEYGGGGGGGGGGSRRASPMTPSMGDYSPVPHLSSPRKHSRTHEIVQDGEQMSLFRTSPLLSSKVPRSPKVHPSPKVKKSSSKSQRTPTNEALPSNRSTKHDLLAKRFDQRRPERERVVMGSDNTPTSSVISPPSDSYKTECETPTNINIDMSQVSRRSVNNLTDTSAPCKQNDIKLQDLDKSVTEDRKPASGTSDDSTTSAEKSPGSQMTTSFIENGGVNKARRPTSLTESYSKMSLASIMGKISSAENSNSKPNSECNGKADRMSISVSSSDDRQNVLPKPDGQSPKSPRVEELKDSSQNSSPAKTSKGSTPKSVRSLRSDRTDASGKTCSPARSINTPSDTIELEYDDFIDMDDTYSYFDPVETEKLTWHGTEKVKTLTPKTEQK